MKKEMDLYRELKPMFDRVDTGEPLPMWCFWVFVTLLSIGPVIFAAVLIKGML